MDDKTKEQIADGILGIEQGDPPDLAPAVPGKDPNKYGMDALSFDEAVDIAQKKFLQFSKIFYKRNADNVFMHSSDIIYGDNGGIGINPVDLRYVIYDTYIKNINKKFDPNPNMDTMCTDGEVIYMNPWFIAALKPEEILFILAHEVNHIKLLHAGDDSRLNIFQKAPGQTPDSNDPGVHIRHTISNIVTDLIINDTLVDDQIGSFPKHPETGKNFGMLIKGYGDMTSEEGIIEFSNLLVQRGLSAISKMMKEELGQDITVPVIPKAKTLAGSRIIIDSFIEFIRSISKNISDVIKEKIEEALKAQQQSGQDNSGGQGGDGGGGQGGAEKQGGDGHNDVGQDSQNSNGDAKSRGGSPDPKGSDPKGSGSKKPGTKDRGDGAAADKQPDGQAGQKDGNGQPKTRQSEINDMVDSAVQNVINSIINDAVSQQLAQSLGNMLQGSGNSQQQGSGGGQQQGSGNGQSPSGQQGGLSDDDIKKIADELAKALGNGDIIFGDHEMQDKLIEAQGKIEGMSPEEMKDSIHEGMVLIDEQMINNLVRSGLTMDKIAGLGHIGKDLCKVWKERQYKPERPYDKILTNLFEKINTGNQSPTYSKYNRRNTVLNAANKMMAQIGGYEANTIIIPSKRSTAGKIVIAIDVSGSICEDNMSMGMAFSEILRLTDILNRDSSQCDIEVIYCDTVARVDGPFQGGSPEMLEYIDHIKQHGINIGRGGGTDLLPVWQNIIKEGEETGKMPSGLLFVTDTDTNSIDQIVELYDSMQFDVPTVILYPDENRLSQEFVDLESRNPNFLLANIHDLLKTDKEYEPDLEI